MTSYLATLESAVKMDSDDPLRKFRDKFWIPLRADGEPQVYFVGHSLGLQPRQTAAYIEEELEKWQTLGVRGHFESDRPWVTYQDRLAPVMADLVGAEADEVVIMNGLTVNLHLMMATFYRPTRQRHKILLEAHAFPSDQYAVHSQLTQHGLDPHKSLVVAKPADGQSTLSTATICELIDQHRESVALVLLPGIQYYTGQALDLAAISTKAHEVGAIMGVDLAHAVGNIRLSLNAWNIDFAVWCTYKYLNSGPGGVAGCFVHRRHATRTDLPRLAGWWGQDKASRFQMGDSFQPIPSAEGWQLSNPPILALAATRASLDIFQAAGGISPLREKSLRLTGYLEYLLTQRLGDELRIITPADPLSRGCQLSLELQRPREIAKAIYQRLLLAGFATDWREPNVIRAAPVPLYNSFLDTWHFVEALKLALDEAPFAAKS